MKTVAALISSSPIGRELAPVPRHSPGRLSWRHWALPSATLDEIQGY